MVFVGLAHQFGIDAGNFDFLGRPLVVFRLNGLFQLTKGLSGIVKKAAKAKA